MPPLLSRILTRTYAHLCRSLAKREREEARLRFIESQLIESQAIARLGSWMRDFRTGELWWSDEHYAMYGVEPGTPLTHHFHEQFFDEAGLAAMRQGLKTLETQGSHSLEVDIYLADGTRKTVRYLARIDHKNGDKFRAYGTVQDITETRAADERLRQSEERFRLVSQATNDAVWDWDLETNLVWRSEGFEGVSTLDSKAPVIFDVETWKEQIHPEDATRVALSLMQAIESGQDVWSQEYRIRRADGSWATIFDRGYIQRDAERRPKRVTGAMSDVTERKLLEEQLAHTRRVHSLGRVAAGAAAAEGRMSAR